MVFRSPAAVNQVIAGHYRPGVGLTDHNFKLFQVDFPCRTLRNTGIRILAVCLLVVQRKVLQAGRHMAALYAAHHGRRLFSRQERIFRIILKISSAQRAPVNVHGRRKPHIDVVFARLFSPGPSNLIDHIRIPCTSQKCGAGEGCGTHACLLRKPDSCRPVLRHDVGNPRFRKISPPEGIGAPGVRCSGQQPGQLFVREGLNKFLQCHFPFRNRCQLRALRCLISGAGFLVTNLRRNTLYLIRIFQRSKNIFVRIRLLPERKPFVGSVRQHALFQLCGNKPLAALFCHYVFFQSPGKYTSSGFLPFQDFPVCVRALRFPGTSASSAIVRRFAASGRGLKLSAHIRTQIEMIFSGLQHPGGFADFPQIVIAGHPLRRKHELYPLAFSRFQQPRFLVISQHA